MLNDASLLPHGYGLKHDALSGPDVSNDELASAPATAGGDGGVTSGLVVPPITWPTVCTVVVGVAAVCAASQVTKSWNTAGLTLSSSQDVPSQMWWKVKITQPP